MMGKLADNFMDRTLSVKKPVPVDQITGFRSLFRPQCYTTYNNWWGDQDGGLVYQEQHDKYTFPKHYERMYYAPAFLNFVTDLTASPLDNQGKPCGDMEIKALECVEYYGKQRGFAICKDYYDDYQECRFQEVQHARYHAMQKEYLKRQYKKMRGLLSEDKLSENGSVYKAPLPGWCRLDPLKTAKTMPILDFMDH